MKRGPRTRKLSTKMLSKYQLIGKYFKMQIIILPPTVEPFQARRKKKKKATWSALAIANIFLLHHFSGQCRIWATVMKAFQNTRTLSGYHYALQCVGEQALNLIMSLGLLYFQNFPSSFFFFVSSFLDNNHQPSVSIQRFSVVMSTIMMHFSKRK